MYLQKLPTELRKCWLSFGSSSKQGTERFMAVQHVQVVPEAVLRHTSKKRNFVQQHASAALPGMHGHHVYSIRAFSSDAKRRQTWNRFVLGGRFSAVFLPFHAQFQNRVINAQLDCSVVCLRSSLRSPADCPPTSHNKHQHQHKNSNR